MSKRPRHQARRQAVQFLFQRDFNSGEIEQALTDFWDSQGADPQVRTFAEELIRGVEDNLGEIDALLQESAEHWDIDRMGAVDRNVMRVAIYEMLHRDDIPEIVSINEAVDLAKMFSDEKSGRFVNGILDRIRKELIQSREPS